MFVGQNTIHKVYGEKARIDALCSDFHQSRSILGSPDDVSVGELLLFGKNFTCGHVLEGVEMLLHERNEDTQRTILGLLAFLNPQHDARLTLGRELTRLADELVEISSPSELRSRNIG